MHDAPPPPQPSAAYLTHVARETVARLDGTQTVGSPFRGAGPALLDDLEAAVEAVKDDAVELSHQMHRHPELAFEEHGSAARIAALLGAHGVDVTVGVHGLDTALRARACGGRPGRTIAILAEYDALPEIGHACGHNVIAGTGVGAFLALHRLAAERPDALPGTVVLLGTPAEEGHSGKEYLARDGAFDDLDAAIMLHPYGYDLTDQVWLGRRLLRITFVGTPAHASAEPFMGRNALDAANLVYQGIGLLRQQLLPVDRVHAILTEGGDRASIIPERATLQLYLRSKYCETLKDLSLRVTDIAHGAALMAGVGVELEWDHHPPSLPVRCNQALTGRWALAQARRGRRSLPAGIVPETAAASTDFGNVSQRVPGIHPLLKVAEPGVALHTRGFAAAAVSGLADAAVADGAFGLAATALDFLVDDALAAAVADEFAAAGGRLDVPAYFD